MDLFVTMWQLRVAYVTIYDFTKNENLKIMVVDPPLRVEEAEPKAELNPCPGLELDLPVTVEMDVTGGSHGFVTSGARNRGLLENFVQSFNKNNIWFFSSHHSFNLKVSVCSLLLCHVQSTRLAMFPWREGEAWKAQEKMELS